MLDQELKNFVLIQLEGLLGNQFVPFANHGSHNYRNGVAHTITRINGRGNSVRGYREYAEEEGNAINLNEEARLVYTEKGVDNILKNINIVKKELVKLEEEFLSIKEKVKEKGVYDPKTERLEEMLVLLREKNTDPAIIVDKLLKAVNSGW
jgi:glycosyltransferase involved in cell wall biosynthesis